MVSIYHFLYMNGLKVTVKGTGEKAHYTPTIFKTDAAGKILFYNVEITAGFSPDGFLEHPKMNALNFSKHLEKMIKEGFTLEIEKA